MSPSADEVAASIQSHLHDKLAGTFRFWGVWFGRPYDNWHIITAAAANGDRLDVTCDEGDTVSVWHPVGVSFHEHSFIIRSASRVLWQWYWYGRPRVQENLMYYDFVRRDAAVDFESNFPHASAEKPSDQEPAVALY